MFFLLFLLLVSVIFYISSQPLMQPLGPCEPLRVTSYDARVFGSSCGNRRRTKTGPRYLYVAAPSYPFRDNARPCGVCYEVTGSEGSIRVMVTSTCPECPEDPYVHFDLSLETWPRIFPDGTGYELATFREITCDVEGPVKFKWADTSSIWWFAITFFNHLTGIQKLEIRDHVASSTDWEEVTRADYNAFPLQCPDGSFSFPFQMRVTDFYDDVIQFQVDKIKGGKVIELERQFVLPAIAGNFNATCCEQQEVFASIYSDGDLPGRWQDWSSGTTKNLQETTNPYSGDTYCLRVNYDAWQWLQFGQHLEARVDQYEFLQFYARLGPGGGTYDDLEVRFSSVFDRGDPVVVSVAGITESWQQFQVPVAGSVSLSSIRVIGFVNNEGTPVTLYFADIQLTPMAGAPDISTCAPGVVGGPPPEWIMSRAEEVIAYLVGFGGTGAILAAVIVLIIVMTCQRSSAAPSSKRELENRT